MPGILRTLYGLVMAVWVGVMGYFGAVLTPTLFRVFPEQFGEIVAALFPTYFRLGEILAGAAAALALAEWLLGRRDPAGSGARWRLIVAVAALALAVYNREILLPQAHTARGTEAFGRLHGISLALNLVDAALALVGALIAHAGAGRRREATP